MFLGHLIIHLTIGVFDFFHGMIFRLTGASSNWPAILLMLCLPAYLGLCLVHPIAMVIVVASVIAMIIYAFYLNYLDFERDRTGAQGEDDDPNAHPGSSGRRIHTGWGEYEDE